MIREMLRAWRHRRSVPPAMRKEVPHEGGRGTLAPQPVRVEAGRLGTYAVDEHGTPPAHGVWHGLIVKRPESTVLIQGVAAPLPLWIHAIRDAAQRSMTLAEHARLAQRRYEDPNEAAQRANALGAWNRR